MKALLCKQLASFVARIACLCATLLLVPGTTLSQPEDTDFYVPEMWREYIEPRACLEYAFKPDTGLHNSNIVFYGDLPAFGYPLHTCLVSGINDTLNAGITLYNGTSKDYVIKGTKYEFWFAPQIYQLFVAATGGLPFRDSTEIGYRFRYWSHGRIRIPTIDALTVEESGRSSLKIDIWNLPEGRFQICLQPTDKVPSDFNAKADGYVFDYHAAQNLADSCNAYEACFWRADEDSNFSAAKDWAGKITGINPASVPGWWLTAYNALQLQDTTAAKSAFDKAIDYLNKGADPAMPDSTKRPLMEIEKLYILWLQRWLPWNRAQLGP